VPIQLTQCCFPGWPLPILKHKYIFQTKYTKAVLSNNTLKLLSFEISKMLIAVLENKFIVLFIIIFRTLLFPILCSFYPRDVLLARCLSVSLFVSQSVSQSVCLSVCLSVCQSVCLSVSLSVCLSVCLASFQGRRSCVFLGPDPPTFLRAGSGLALDPPTF